MTLSLTTSNKQIIIVEDRPIACGGEGAVHKIVSPSSMCDFCVKLYSVQPRTTPQRERKIAYMIHNPPPDLQTSNYLICWPAERVYENNRFAGFVMPLAYSGSTQLYEICTTKIRDSLPDVWRKKFDRSLNAGMISRLKLCVNIAIAVHCIHLLGKYVLIDMQPRNILITHDGKICIIDTDSIQISNRKQVIYPGAVATPEYIPLEGKQLTPSKHYIPESWDRFSIAVMFYEILFGLHPFASTAGGKYKNCTQISDKIPYGLSHLGINSKYIVTLPPLHNNFSNVPKPVQILFYKTFKDGHNKPDVRPSADIWGKTIYSEITKQKTRAATLKKPPPIIRKASKRVKQNSFLRTILRRSVFTFLTLVISLLLVFKIMQFINTDYRNVGFASKKEKAGITANNRNPRDLITIAEMHKVSEPLRSTPLAISGDDFQKVFNLDEKLRPHKHIKNDFKNQGNVVIDRATGLMWQKSGSDKWLTYSKAQDYIKKLNQDRFAGYNDWRLPTIAELISLLKPEKQSNDLYIDPIFDKKHYCWSSDTVRGSSTVGGSPGSAWNVDFSYGTVDRYNFLGYGDYVRAVRTVTSMTDHSRNPRNQITTAKIQKVSESLRSMPLAVLIEDAKKVFNLEENWYPRKYIKNAFKDQGNVVIDRATGLMWQKSGSHEWLTYKEAQDYIAKLNQDGFAGHNDWRLPTMPELISLLKSEKQSDGLYLDPIFDNDRDWCWSSDTVGDASGAAWSVYFIHGGGISNYDLADYLYVRSVRTEQ